LVEDATAALFVAFKEIHIELKKPENKSIEGILHHPITDRPG
jgi:hypothetical protein